MNEHMIKKEWGRGVVAGLIDEKIVSCQEAD